MLHEASVKAKADEYARGGSRIDVTWDATEALLFSEIICDPIDEAVGTAAVGAQCRGVSRGESGIRGKHTERRRDDGEKRGNATGARHERVDMRLKLTRQPFAQRGDDQLLAACEVAVNRPLGNPAFACDLLRRQVGEAAVAHQAFGSVDELLARSGCFLCSNRLARLHAQWRKSAVAAAAPRNP
jgi:hypothetical protein